MGVKEQKMGIVILKLPDRCGSGKGDYKYA